MDTEFVLWISTRLNSYGWIRVYSVRGPRRIVILAARGESIDRVSESWDRISISCFFFITISSAFLRGFGSSFFYIAYGIGAGIGEEIFTSSFFISSGMMMYSFFGDWDCSEN